MFPLPSLLGFVWRREVKFTATRAQQVFITITQSHAFFSHLHTGLVQWTLMEPKGTWWTMAVPPHPCPWAGEPLQTRHVGPALVLRVLSGN